MLVILWQIGSARRPPALLAANCTTASFRLSAETVKQARPVTYTMVGPADGRFVLGVDTQTFTHNAAGGWDAVPLPGHDSSYEVAAGVKPMKGCRRTGIFALPTGPVGPHVVTMYTLAGTTATEVSHTTITVTAQ